MGKRHGGEKETQPPCNDHCLAAPSEIWPVISEDVQERCLKRISGRVRFIEGLSPQLQTQATVDAVSDHPEQQLLAYVFGDRKSVV